MVRSNSSSLPLPIRMENKRPRDRYGSYSLLTGHEEPGRCFWCGTEVRKSRRYCCKEHSDLYWKHFGWGFAAPWCLERYNQTCADCGEKGGLVAHHIKPLNGAQRTWNILNRPENLVALCHKCHQRRHHPPVPSKVLDIPAWQDNLDKARQRGQLVMDVGLPTKVPETA